MKTPRSSSPARPASATHTGRLLLCSWSVPPSRSRRRRRLRRRPRSAWTRSLGGSRGSTPAVSWCATVPPASRRRAGAVHSGYIVLSVSRPHGRRRAEEAPGCAWLEGQAVAAGCSTWPSDGVRSAEGLASAPFDAVRPAPRPHLQRHAPGLPARLHGSQGSIASTGNGAAVRIRSAPWVPPTPTWCSTVAGRWTASSAASTRRPGRRCRWRTARRPTPSSGRFSVGISGSFIEQLRQPLRKVTLSNIPACFTSSPSATTHARSTAACSAPR